MPTDATGTVHDQALGMSAIGKSFITPEQLAKAISIEAGELLECFLWKTESEIDMALNDAAFLSSVRDEIADVLAFTVSMADCLGIDLSTALKEKLGKNAAKYPPEKVKGSTKKYTEY
jgi:NTP pyrophosphatase (non-canonical NTP hydrolase)